MPDYPHDFDFDTHTFGRDPVTDSQPTDLLERLLLDDGAHWRTSAPDERDFAERTALLLRRADAGSVAPYTDEDMTAVAKLLDDIPRQGPAMPPLPPPRRRASTVGAFVAVAAAVVVVGLMAAIFQMAAPGHGPASGKLPTPAPTTIPHVTHARGQWHDGATYNVGSHGTIYVAPSDPNVVYRVMDPPSGPPTAILQRTDDGGATWTPLPYPTLDGAGTIGTLAISPLDAHTVFMLVPGDAANPNCPAPSPNMAYTGGRLYSGGYSCTFEYVSRDGGLHWSHPGFPLTAQHLAGSRQGEAGGESGPIQAQGTTLYTTITGNLNGEAFFGSRLVSSDDGGTTWRLLDAGIAAHGQTVTDFLAVPSSDTVFASTLPQNTPYGQEVKPALWRSDDAGAHWTQVGTLPDAYDQLAGAWNAPHGLVLYALGRAMIYGSSVQPWDGVMTSVDGGQTWQNAPATGFAWNTAGIVRVVGVLADGSLALAVAKQMQPPSLATPSAPEGAAIYPTDGTNLAAWRLGDSSWFQVTPQLGTGHTDAAWLETAASGAQSLWIVYGENNAQTLTLRRCPLS